MAYLNTAAKRKSSISMLMPFMPPGVIPGGVARENRRAGAWTYSGISNIISTIDTMIKSITINRTMHIVTINRIINSITIGRTINQK